MKLPESKKKHLQTTNFGFPFPSIPWDPGDVTYVLDRPTARGFRLALGTAWLAAHRWRGNERLEGNM